jgi:hypothetical protein
MKQVIEEEREREVQERWEDNKEDVSSCWITVRKREDTVNLKRKH